MISLYSLCRPFRTGAGCSCRHHNWASAVRLCRIQSQAGVHCVWGCHQSQRSADDDRTGGLGADSVRLSDNFTCSKIRSLPPAGPCTCKSATLRGDGQLCIGMFWSIDEFRLIWLGRKWGMHVLLQLRRVLERDPCRASYRRLSQANGVQIKSAMRIMRSVCRRESSRIAPFKQ